MTHHQDAVADPHDLVEPVRDEDDRAQLAQRLDLALEDLGLVALQHGRRLVEDDAGAGRAPTSSTRSARAISTICRSTNGRSPTMVRGSTVEPTRASTVSASWFSRFHRYQPYFVAASLLDTAFIAMFSATDRLVSSDCSWCTTPMPAATASCGRRKLHRLAEHLDGAGVRLVDAGEDLQQARLAGAVLADETDHLVAADLEGDVLDGGDPIEGLGDVGEAKCRGVRVGGGPRGRGDGVVIS